MALVSTSGLDDRLLFDAQYYSSLYPELQTAFGGDPALLRDHWLTSGIYQGRRASPIFDCDLYLSLYPDLRNAFGSDCASAMRHFRNMGLPNEARRAAVEFDVSSYLNRYPDLRVAFGNNGYLAAAKHFMTVGLWQEGRAGSNEFDASYYLCHYPDLASSFHTNYRFALEHFETQGLPNEARRGSAHFDVATYLSRYLDLRNAFGSNFAAAMKHWLTNGIYEGRSGDPADGGGVMACPTPTPAANPDAFTQADFTSGTCSSYQQDQIRQALAIIHDQLVDTPQPMTDCLREAVFQGPVFLETPMPNYGDIIHPRHAEAIISELTRTAHTIPFTCVTPPGASPDWGMWNGSAIEIRPGTFLYENYTVNFLASVVIHEIGHMFRGWDHTAQFLTEGFRAITYQLGDCSKQVSSGANPPKPTHWGPNRLSDFPGEVALQPVGHTALISQYVLPAERYYRSTCPSDLFAQGIAGFAGTGVQSIRMACTNPAATTIENSPLVGDSNGAQYFGQYCFPGEVMVGLWGKAGARLNSIGPVCAPTSQVQAGLQDNLYADATNGSWDSAAVNWRRVCPTGMAVRSVRGHFGQAANASVRVIDSIQVVCQSIGSPRSIDVQFGGGFQSTNTSPWVTTECSGRAALTSLMLAWNNDGIGRISGWCQDVVGQGATLTFNSETTPHLLSGLGQDPLATGYGESRDDCASGQALVGIDVGLYQNMTGGIRAARGICANARGWATITYAPEDQLPWHGPGGSLFPNWRCPSGSLLTGVRVQGESFTNMQLVCRSFQ